MTRCVSLGVVAFLATLSAPVGVAARPLGPSGPSGCTISGTDGNDVLRGTPRQDVICGLNGDDAIVGLGGGDRSWGVEATIGSTEVPARTTSAGSRSRPGHRYDVANGGPGRDVYDADAGDVLVSVEAARDC